MVLKTDQLEKYKRRERTTEQAGSSSQQSCVASLFEQSRVTPRSLRPNSKRKRPVLQSRAAVLVEREGEMW